MIIRKATLEDLEDLARLMREYDVYENKLNKKVQISSIKENKKLISKHIKSKSITHTVFEKDGKIVGLINWDIRSDNKAKKGVIHNLIIDKDYRGKKIGTKLVDYVIKEFKKRGCTKVGSFVRIANKGALEFWKKQGFDNNEAGYSISKRLK